MLINKVYRILKAECRKISKRHETYYQYNERIEMELIVIVLIYGSAALFLSSNLCLSAVLSGISNSESFSCGYGSTETEKKDMKPSPGQEIPACMKNSNTKSPLVGIIMGSRSDWETMIHAAKTLEKLGIPHEVEIVSAHRTPDRLFSYVESAEERGMDIIIAGAGGAAHLPGMAASKCILPVLGVPVQSKALNGMDSLLSIVQMPAGIPVGTLAIGRAGAVNAALLAAGMLGRFYPEIRQSLIDYRKNQTEEVLAQSDPGRDY